MLTYPDDEWVIRVKDAASDAFGVPKPLFGFHWGLDVDCAIKRTNQSVCAFGVCNSTDSNVHGPDENVMINDL